jgi:hypothetical protein
VIGGNSGMRADRFQPSATLTGRLDNNLFAYMGFGVFIGEGLEADFGNDHNAVYGIGIGNQYTPGPNTVTSDPLLATLTRPRLAAESPLREAGSATLRAAPGPGALSPLEPLDADGLRRVKDAALDIGAYEYGDATLTWNTSGFANVSTIDDPRLNGDAGEVLQVTRSGGDRPSDTTPNPRPMTQRYSSAGARWELLADDGFNINVGAGFQLLAAGSGAGRGVHVSTAGNVSGPLSALDAAFASLPPDTILLVTPTRDVGGIGAANPHPVAATYQFGGWYVWNLDGAPMPLDTRFALYAQRPSANAYLHVAGASNQPTASTTVLDHPLLNGNRCAAPHVALGGNGALNPHPIGVRYDTALQRWYARNEDAAAMPAGAQLFVVVDPAAGEATCAEAVFASGFEDAI